MRRLIILLVILGIFQSYILTSASELKEDQEEIGAKWTERLKLSDFNLSSDSLELKDMRKIRKLADALSIDYKNHGDVFGAAIPYGAILVDIGEIEEADKVWAKALEDFYKNPTPPVFKAWVNARKGKYLEAMEAWMKVAKKQVDLGSERMLQVMWLPEHFYSVLGLYLIKDFLPEKDRIEAEEITVLIAKHHPTRPQFAPILITEDLRAGRLQSAAKRVEKVLSKYADSYVILTLGGITELLSGNHEDALELLEKSHEVYPNSPTNNLMRARAFYALKKKKEAKAALKEAINLDPSIDPGFKKDKILVAKSYIEQSDENLKTDDVKHKKEEVIKELKKAQKSKEEQEAKVPEKF